MFRDIETFAMPAAELAIPPALHLYDHGGDSEITQITYSLRRIDAAAIAMDPLATSALTQIAYQTAATCSALVWC
jgi:hypothetical protein